MIYTIPPPRERRRSGIIYRELGEDTQKVNTALKAFQFKCQTMLPQDFILTPWGLFSSYGSTYPILCHLDQRLAQLKKFAKPSGLVGHENCTLHQYSIIGPIVARAFIAYPEKMPPSQGMVCSSFDQRIELGMNYHHRRWHTSTPSTSSHQS